LKLRKNQPCPIHKGARNCCGRANSAPIQKRKYESFEQGVSRIPDETVARGYRERRSKSAMNRLLNQKIREQHGLCGICKKEFDEISQVVADHIEPRGFGGGRRDDSSLNIQAAHSICNHLKGSRRDFECPKIERAS